MFSLSATSVRLTALVSPGEESLLVEMDRMVASTVTEPEVTFKSMYWRAMLRYADNADR